MVDTECPFGFGGGGDGWRGNKLGLNQTTENKKKNKQKATDSSEERGFHVLDQGKRVFVCLFESEIFLVEDRKRALAKFEIHCRDS